VLLHLGPPGEEKLGSVVGTAEHLAGVPAGAAAGVEVAVAIAAAAAVVGEVEEEEGGRVPRRM
jgi:hypothetical protein